MTFTRERLLEIIDATELYSRIDIISQENKRITPFYSENLQDLCRLALRGLESEKLSANIDFAIILIAESVNGLFRGVNPIDDLRSTNKMLRDALAKYRAEIGEI